MSLFRFSIYAKLFACIGAAGLLLDETISPRRVVRVGLMALPVILLMALGIVRLAAPGSAAGVFIAGNLHGLLIFTALLAGGCIVLVRGLKFFPPLTVLAVAMLLAIVLFAQRDHLGLRLALQDDDDADYLALCDFARDHTPADALFVVPPNEQVFRYRAQRAIVVNFKNVPQLSGEMGEWKSRLETVLGEPLSALPRRFDRAHAAIAARYNARSAGELADVAARFHADYIVTPRALSGVAARFENRSYHLYALSDLAPAALSAAAWEGAANDLGRIAGKTQDDPGLAGGERNRSLHSNPPAGRSAAHALSDPRP